MAGLKALFCQENQASSKPFDKDATAATALEQEKLHKSNH
jgi:hypothetical protein